MRVSHVQPVQEGHGQCDVLPEVMESLSVTLSGTWAKLAISLRAILAGLLIALPAANVWPLLLLNLGALFASIAQAMFLALYIWWAAGGSPPRASQTSRATAFRRGTLSAAQWLWGMVAAFCFALTIHASIVLLFRFVPFPVAEFRRGYDFSFIPTVPLRWLAVVISAASAGICEETGFRGYMPCLRSRCWRYGGSAARVSTCILLVIRNRTVRRHKG